MSPYACNTLEQVVKQYTVQLIPVLIEKKSKEQEKLVV